MVKRIWQNWKKWNKIRATILERDRYKCWYCKITQNKLAKKYGRKTRLLIVHHIIPEHFPDDKINDEQNLVTLCYKCHYNAAIIGSDIHAKLQKKLQLALAARKNKARIAKVGPYGLVRAGNTRSSKKNILPKRKANKKGKLKDAACVFLQYAHRSIIENLSRK